MKLILSLVLLLASALTASAITIDLVPVFDAGNPDDPSDGDQDVSGVQNFGAVGYEYSISKYEVTVGQYTAFLNAVAKTADTYALWNSGMQSNTNTAGIRRTTDSGTFTYSAIGSPNHPVVFISWGDAARFCNWMHNGQPSGAQGPGTTETGAYTLNGATTDSALMAVTRNPGATWFIPTENEWYKAAFYQPAAQGGDSDSYWRYQMKTNIKPNSAAAPGSTAPDPSRTGNFYANDGVANGYDGGFALTNSPILSDSVNMLTDVGAYTSASSYYGTFDQAGNVGEWNETAVTATTRGMRGAWWLGPAFTNVLDASARLDAAPTLADNADGFRVASIFVPESASAVLLAVSAFALIAIRRR